jgi:indolepyruvate decarboxylase
LRRIRGAGDATRGRFQLIDIRLARGACSPTLSRFVQAVKRLNG